MFIATVRAVIMVAMLLPVPAFASGGMNYQGNVHNSNSWGKQSYHTNNNRSYQNNNAKKQYNQPYNNQNQYNNRNWNKPQQPKYNDGRNQNYGWNKQYQHDDKNMYNGKNMHNYHRGWGYNNDDPSDRYGYCRMRQSLRRAAWRLAVGTCSTFRRECASTGQRERRQHPQPEFALCRTASLCAGSQLKLASSVGSTGPDFKRSPALFMFAVESCRRMDGIQHAAPAALIAYSWDDGMVCVPIMPSARRA